MGLRDRVGELYRHEMEIPFTLKEYKRRLTKIREAMAKEKIDVLYCTAPESLFYIAGYEAAYYGAQTIRAFAPLSAVAIKQDADTFILFDRSDEEVLAYTHSIATDIRIYEEGSAISHEEFIIKNLKEAGWLKGTVGLEKCSYRPSPAISQMYQAAVEKEGCNVVDGSSIVREVRVIKSPQEIVYTRTAARIADIAMKAAIDHLKSGMTELDVGAEVQYAYGKAGGEAPGLPVFVHTGHASTHCHALPSRRVIMPGDIVHVDLCGVYHRYHADLGRMFSMGEPDIEVAKELDLSAKAWPVLLKIIKPGLAISELNKVMKNYYRGVGIWEDRWWVGGYELGISFPPDWMGIFFYDPDVDAGGRILRPGTVINYESDFYLPQGAGLSLIIDTIAFEEETAEILSKIPPDLVVVEP